MRKRKEQVKGIYIDLPIEMYQKLETTARSNSCTKRFLVVQAIRKHLYPEGAK